MHLSTSLTNAKINYSILVAMKDAGLIELDQRKMFDISILGGFSTVLIDTDKLDNLIEELGEMSNQQRKDIAKQYEARNS